MSVLERFLAALIIVFAVIVVLGLLSVHLGEELFESVYEYIEGVDNGIEM